MLEFKKVKMESTKGIQPSKWDELDGQLEPGEAAEFENDSAAFNKTFHVFAYSPEKGFFITIFDDVTACKKAEIALKKKGEELDKILEDIIARESKMIEMKKELEAMSNVSPK